MPHGGSGGDEDEDGGFSSDGSVKDFDGGDGDGGSGFDAGDTALTDCRDVDAVPPGTDPDPNVLANVVTTPADLAVTRASATWDASCAQPTLRVTVSDGTCPNGDGHELTFYLPAADVEERTLTIGQNVIMEDAAGHIRVRYTRPGRLEPSGQWGTCSGASGTLDIIGQLELIQGRTLQGNFVLDLTRCDDGEPSVQQVEGSFNVTVPASLDDICP